MKPYPLEFRRRIVEAVQDGLHTITEIAELFGVGERSVYKLLQRQRETGDVVPKPHGGGAAAKLTGKHLSELADLVSQSPDATLEELQQQVAGKLRLPVSLSTVWRGLERLTLTRKKSPGAAPKPTRQHGRPSAKSSPGLMSGD